MSPTAANARDLIAQVAPFWRRLQAIAERLGFSGLAQVVPSYHPDGVLKLRACDTTGQTLAALALGTQPSTPNERGVVAIPGLGYTRALLESPQNALLAKSLALAWAASKGSPESSFLALCNRELTRFELDAQAMDRLIARRFDPGRSMLHGFLFSATEEEPGNFYAFLFTRPNATATLRLALYTPLATAAAPRLMPLGPFSLALSYGSSASALHPLAQLGELEALDPAAAKAAAALCFLLSRALPAGIELGDYTPQARVRNDGSLASGSASGEGGPLLSSTLHADTIWRRFFVPFEAERELVCNFPNSGRDQLGRVLFFMHGEAECTCIQPNTSVGVAFQKPVARAVENTANNWDAPPSQPRDEPSDPALQLSVLMNERDVIYGASERYAAELAKQRQNAKPGDLIMVNETCVARIMSEDLSLHKRAHLAAGGAPIIELAITQSGPLEILGDLVRQLKAVVLPDGDLAPHGGIVENGVAFVGFAKGPFEAEVRGFLRELGLEFQGFFLPLLDRGDLLGALRAKWLVCHPAPIWQTICTRHLEGAHSRRLTPPLPYGPHTTLRFFTEIAQAVVDEEKLRLLSERAAAFAPNAEPFSGEPIELGYVLDSSELSRLLVCASPQYVPALAFLEELGFAQRLFHYLPPGQDAARSEAEIRTMLAQTLKNPAAITVCPFGSKEELQSALLAAGTTRLVYSQFSFDRRLLYCGKAAFDLADLEPGFRGALRTAHRLRERAGWDGPARLGRYVDAPGWQS